MKRFISRKTIKVPRYKILYIGTMIVIILIIVLNLGINLLVSNNKDLIENRIIKNAFGNIIPNYKNYSFKDLLRKNLYGIDIELSETVGSINNNIKDLVIENKKEGNPIIYIYNTFQTSKYKSNNYHSYNINSLVTQASKIFEEYLGLLGINSLVETDSVAKVLKDNNIAYTYSYRGSRILLEKAKNNNSSLNYFIDLQLSNDTYEATTAKIDNNTYAKVLFVVGTLNSNYTENQKLANSLNNILISKSKDLSRGVSLRGGTGYHGVYNQDINSNAILIIVGGKENTIDEVNRTLKILAKVFKDYIGDANEEK